MEETTAARNFIEEAIEQDMLQKENRLQTRFPPEPNGYLHIGHVKAICVDFGTALKYGGTCNLRFDDTNPTKEDTEYVDSIMEDVRWLGFSWDNVYYASDYFQQLYDNAVRLIERGLAYVDDLSAEEIRAYRGTLTEPGKNSPYRDRSIAENLALFERMKNGEFPDGKCVLRAKIDMASPNINMRDPVMYRIVRAHHHRTGDQWLIYPMYDYAHPVSDAIEGVTHSLCTLEFEDHRPLYDWFVQAVGFAHPPRQIEFARLNLTRTIMSKRYLKKLVETGAVDGWDDPRMPTICGLRRRGYTPESLRDFCDRIGVAKSNSVVEASLLEHCVREDLNAHAPRLMAVQNPLKLTITNWPEGQKEDIVMEYLPNDEAAGTRTVHFGRTLYIEREDFMIDAPKKFFRLKPDGEVRLKGAYIVRCTGYETDADGNVTEVFCTYDPETRSGNDTRKVKGTLHWVAADECVDAPVRLYDYLLLPEEDGEKRDFSERMTPNSVTERTIKIEPAILDFAPGTRFQFIRLGYYIIDTKDSRPDKPVINRIVELKDSYKPGT